jgi:hypothetical protein
VNIRLLVAIVASLLAAGPELCDNPAYRAWAAFKPGSSVTCSTITTQGGSKLSDVQTTLQLVQVREDRIVLESSGSMEAGDSRMQLPAQQEQIPARLAAEPVQDGRITDERDETLAIGDQKLPTHRTRRVSEAGGIRTETTTWASDAIPGGVVRQQILVVTGKERTITTVEVLRFEAKR